MDISKSLKIAAQALLTNKLRAGLTMLGVIIGVFSIILLIAVGSGLQYFITRELQNLGSNLVLVVPGKMEMDASFGGEKKAMPGGFGTSKLKLEDVSRIKREVEFLEGVTAVVQTSGFAKYGSESEATQISGVSADYPQVRHTEAEKGKFLSVADIASSKRVAVLGPSLAKDLFGSLDPLGKRIDLSGQKYTVVGVTFEKGSLGQIDLDNQVYVPVTTAQKQFGLNTVNLIFARAESAETLSAVKESVNDVLLKRLTEDDFTVTEQKEMLETVDTILNVLKTALGGIASISLLVGGIGIMNIMLVSVTERTREIGLRKAVGAKPKDILSQFLIEAVSLSVTGGGLGVLLAILGAAVVNRFTGEYFALAITFWSVALAFFFSAAVGIIFGIAPAIRASKLDPIEALRYE